MDNNYKVYIHINKINGKRYIGITKQKVEKRWQNGNHYKRNKEFTEDIKIYGWENFYHYVLMEGLTYKEAKCNEEFLIRLWGTNDKEKGYNIRIGNKGDKHTETKEKISKSMKKKVICITTNEVFNSQIEGAEFYNIQQSGVSRCCRGKQKSCGVFEGVKLQWKYYDDYLKELNENDSQ